MPGTFLQRGGQELWQHHITKGSQWATSALRNLNITTKCVEHWTTLVSPVCWLSPCRLSVMIPMKTMYGYNVESVTILVLPMMIKVSLWTPCCCCWVQAWSTFSLSCPSSQHGFWVLLLMKLGVEVKRLTDEPEVRWFWPKCAWYVISRFYSYSKSLTIVLIERVRPFRLLLVIFLKRSSMSHLATTHIHEDAMELYALLTYIYPSATRSHQSWKGGQTTTKGHSQRWRGAFLQCAACSL